VASAGICFDGLSDNCICCSAVSAFQKVLILKITETVDLESLARPRCFPENC
jgi:hypothetical protein